MCSLAKTYVDEIVGGDGKRRYNLVRDDGSMAAQNVQIVKAYTPEQEGSTFGAVDVYDLQCKEYTITLTADGWVDGQQTVSLPEIQADAGTVFVGLPAEATREEAIIASLYRVRCTARAQGSLTFACDGTGHPSDNISLKIILTGGSNAIMNGLGGNYMPPKQELCRFTASGTFDPAQYPTIDGLYDVYIVGGGGGAYRKGVFNSYEVAVGGGGGGGYAKLLTALRIDSTVPVTIGGAGKNAGGDNDATAGGRSSFGTHGQVNGGSAASWLSGGDGGCGGAGANGCLGGVDGNGGSYGGGAYGSGNSEDFVSNPGVGGGKTNYTPTNPYDGQFYGIGGNALVGQYNSSGGSYSLTSGCAPLNNNAGRGGGHLGKNDTYDPLPGICIIYGRPLGGVA